MSRICFPDVFFIEVQRHSQQFFSHIGIGPLLPGYQSVLRRVTVDVSCSRTQNGAPCGDRTQDLSMIPIPTV